MIRVGEQGIFISDSAAKKLSPYILNQFKKTLVLDTGAFKGGSSAETDPIFTAWLATPPNVSTFVNDAGYLTSETDPIYSASSWFSTTNNSANWNTAYGWGNHASVGYLTTLNTLTGSSQTFAVGTSGTDFAISSSGTTHTFNLPTASATNRGLLSSTDWTTFNNKFSLPALTSGSVLFSNGTTLAQDNSTFFWDNTNKRLGIGTNNPTFAGYDTKLFINGNGTGINGRTAFVVKNNAADSASSFMLINNANKFGGVSMTGSSYITGEAVNFFSGSTNMSFLTDGNIPTGATSKMFFTTGGWSNSPTMTITGGNPGNIGMGGIINPTARLHLSAGSAIAGTAPFKLTAGTNLATPENGAFEFDGTNLYFTVGGVRKTVNLI